MPITVDSDGRQVVDVNVYQDLHLMKFIVPHIVFDGPGDVVFATEGSPWRGSALTFHQSRVGLNLYSKQGFIQLLTELDVGRGIWFGQLQKREYEEPEAMFRDFAFSRVMRYLPKERRIEEETTADLLLLPRIDRLAQAVMEDPERLIAHTLSIIRIFSDRAAFGNYKSMQYRDKLLSLSSAFMPYREDFLKFEIDYENLQDSAFQLILMFS